jgi:hypothetical protein
MARIRLKAGLPNGEANGLTHHASAFIDDPDTLRLALVLLDTKAMTEDRDDGDTTALARVRRIELITEAGDVAALQRIMLRANEARTGRAMLPFETEKAIDDLFADFAAEAHRDDDDT